MNDAATIYTPELVENLEYRYGEGFLSPGGTDELALMFDGLSVAGTRGLDFGCGPGGYDVELVRTLGAVHVTGVDIEHELVARARQRAAAAELAERLTFVHVSSGPLPFSDGAFDFVFSKDAIVHLADKAAVLANLYRLAAPRGWLVLGDWFASDGPMSPEMRAWATEGDETFEMDSLNAVAGHIENAGFTAIEKVDRNAWFRAFCRDEVARLEGPLFETYARRFGEDQAHRSVRNAKIRLEIAEQGQLRPGHVRARKPE